MNKEIIEIDEKVEMLEQKKREILSMYTNRLHDDGDYDYRDDCLRLENSTQLMRFLSDNERWVKEMMGW